MIDPRIVMVDLEPDGFGVVNKLASDHLRFERAELHVLHRDGIILRAIDTRTGPVTALRGSMLPEPEALRAQTEVERVILVDEGRLAGLTAPLAAAGEAATQDEMFVRSRRTFLESDAVVAHPPRAGGAWETWANHLRSLGDEYVALIAGYDDEACAFTVVAQIRNGLVHRVTSLSPILGDARPPRETAKDLVDAAGKLGVVRLAVVADLGDFGEALASRSLEPLRGAIVCFGLPENL